MHLSRHHRLGLAGVVGIGSIALFDAVTHGLTGRSSVFSDEATVPWIAAAGSMVHGLAYLTMLAVLWAEREHLRPGRWVSLLWWVLFGSFAGFAVTYLGPTWVEALGHDTRMSAVVEPVVTAAFLGHFLAAVGLGFALRRRPEARPGSRILLAILPVIGLTVLVAWLAPTWAHPAYLEITTLLGVALLGADRRAVGPMEALAEPRLVGGS